MCECGCGEAMAPLFRFPGPGDLTYAVALYPGCIECSTPASVILYRIPDAERPHFMLDEFPITDLPWRPLYGWHEVALPVVDRDGLLAAMREELSEPLEDYDAEGALEDASRAYSRAASISFQKFVADTQEGT